MAVKTFEPTVAWPVLMALNGLAVESNAATTTSPWADVTTTPSTFQGTMGGGRSGEQTLVLSVLSAMNPENNPYYNGDEENPGPGVVPSIGDDASAFDPFVNPFITAVGNVGFAPAAKAMADQYVHHAGWDDTASALVSGQQSAALLREKSAAARTFGSMMTLNARMASMTSVVFHAEHVNAIFFNQDFAMGIALNVRQQQGEMFLRRWSAAVRLWEAKQRGRIGLMSTMVDQQKTFAQAENDRLQLCDEAMEKYHTWRLDLWSYLLKGVTAVSGSPVQPRDMTKKERILSAVTNSASVALQTGAAGGNPVAGIGFGAVSLAAQLWGMK
jgi:hypothetical protein